MIVDPIHLRGQVVGGLLVELELRLARRSPGARCRLDVRSGLVRVEGLDGDRAEGGVHLIGVERRQAEQSPDRQDGDGLPGVEDHEFDY